jgi:dolichyl-phosphate beta-glucosyltransferase
MGSMTLSIIIPAYNEVDRLPRTLVAIRDFFSGQAEFPEVLVVDDGSVDGTAAAARAALPTVRVIEHGRNMGKGAAVRTGMLAARGDQRYLCDADLSTPIDEVSRFLTAAQAADIVIGSRRAAGANVTRAQAGWKVLLGQTGNLLIRLLVAPGILDSQCGFKLFAKHTMPIFEVQRIRRWGYDFELLFLARKFGFKVTELPVTWANDERSKVRPSDYLVTLAELLMIRLNDLLGRYAGRSR